MKSNSLYYDDCDFKIGNHEWHTYMCKGMRNRGKTTYWLATVYKRSIVNIREWLDGKVDRVTKRFIYLRRTEAALEQAVNLGVFNGVFSAEPYKYLAQWCSTDLVFQKNKIMTEIEGTPTHIGYYVDLNKIRGLSLEDCDCLLFDEIIEDKRSNYKGGDGGIHEPDILARLDDTLFRKRENWIILLGNDDTASDPYSENFGVPFGVDKWKNKEREFWFEFDRTQAAVDFRHTTATGKRWKGTGYDRFACGERQLDNIDEDFICEKPKHAKLMYNLKVAGERLTVWRDEEGGAIYVHNDCDFDKHLPIISVMNKDMQVDSLFIAYNPAFLQWVKFQYGRGNFRYNNQRTYSLFSIILALDKK